MVLDVADVALPRESLSWRILLREEEIVATADTAEAISQMAANARARRLLRLNSVCVEAGNDLINAHQMVNSWAARDRAGPHVALEEAWRETVRYARENVCLLKNLAERYVVSIRLGPLGLCVGAEHNRVAVVAVRLCDGDLKSGKEVVLCLSQDVASYGPAAVVEALLVEGAVALDHQAAEGIDVVGEHLSFAVAR